MFVNFIDLEVNFRKGKEKLIYSITKEILDKILRIKIIKVESSFIIRVIDGNLKESIDLLETNTIVDFNTFNIFIYLLSFCLF